MDTIKIINPSRKFLFEGTYSAESRKMCLPVELVRLPAEAARPDRGIYFGFRAIGSTSGRFLVPVDPLFWMDDSESIEISVERAG